MTKNRYFKTEEKDDIVVVTLNSARILDEQFIQLMGEALFRLIDEDKRTSIILSLKGIKYLSSVALGKFLILNKKMVSAGGMLIFCCITPALLEIFQIIGLHRILTISENLPGALKYFKKANS